VAAARETRRVISPRGAMASEARPIGTLAISQLQTTLRQASDESRIYVESAIREIGEYKPTELRSRRRNFMKAFPKLPLKGCCAVCGF